MQGAARRVRRQSAILERLRARPATPLAEFKRRSSPKRIAGARPAPHQVRISDLSRADVRRLQGAPRGARRAALRLARHRRATTRPAGSRNTRRTSSSSTRRWRCSSPSTAGSGPASGPTSAAIIHALAFLARGYGLDTCPQEAWARLYDTVGDFLKLPRDADAVLRHRDRLRRPRSTRPTTSARRAPNSTSSASSTASMARDELT